ncbi:dienelactone hydrolase family protein [Fundidesulfovibrio terrae]|uniref:dienelactone hydrolase family protein n=1 Tax=Fundidesulfovibrio terrae TaxID=2922866 RepID=UPI001FAFDC24|nr:dienelactone hydrolase family protein [Fundidesulfovibrio terrae]
MLNFDQVDTCMEFKAGNESLVCVLHEIYGINDHVVETCEAYFRKGYDVVCPNMTGLEHCFPYDAKTDAYNHFMNNVGFASAANSVSDLLRKQKEKYRKIILVGYSVGATVAWLCAGEEGLCDAVVCHYGSRIRDHVDLAATCQVLLLFAEGEKSFDAHRLAEQLKSGAVDVHVLAGKHGFCDRFSENYFDESSKVAEKLVEEFLGKPASPSPGESFVAW